MRRWLCWAVLPPLPPPLLLFVAVAIWELLSAHRYFVFDPALMRLQYFDSARKRVYCLPLPRVLALLPLLTGCGWGVVGGVSVVCFILGC